MKRRTFIKSGSAAALAPLAGCIDLNQGDKPEKPEEMQESDNQETQDSGTIDDNANIDDDSGLDVEESTIEDSTITITVRNTQESVNRVIVRVKLLNSNGEQVGLEQVTSTKGLAPDETGTVTFNPDVDPREVSEYDVSVEGGEPL